MSFVPKGIIPPIVTPFESEGRVDAGALRIIIDYLIENGVHGIFPMGTTGEFYALGENEFARLINLTVEYVGGRVPVYAGCNHITPGGVVRLIKISEKAGADAVSVLTPMFVSQTQAEVYAYYKAVAESSGLPIILYNNRPKTNVTIEPETAARLAELDTIVGIKDTTGDFTNTQDYIRLTRGMDFHVFAGKDTLIHAALCCGAVGAIASCADVAPRLTADIYDKYVAGDIKGSLEAQFALTPLRHAVNKLGTFPAAIKEGMNLLGLPAGKCAAPIANLTDAELKELRRVMVETGLI